MIGDFRTAPPGDPETIYVQLHWQGDRRRARLSVSPDLRQAVALADYPDISTDEMSVASALSYALFLAMQAGFRLRVTGDLSVWDASWGSLVDGPEDQDDQADDVRWTF